MNAVPFVQTPAVQVVLPVHALPSSHAVPFGLIGQPVAGTHVPVV